MSNLSDLVPIPPKENMNIGLSSAREDTMLKKFGKPGQLTKKCSNATGKIKKRLVFGVDVGPFKVNGLDFAVESLRQIFAEAKQTMPQVFDEVKSAGMLCVRARKTNPNRFSNHSWGTTIDLFFGSGVVPQGKRLAHRGPQSPSPTAAAPPKFALIEFYKLEWGKDAEYRKIARELWMPIHRERVKLGKIKSWSLWNVRFSRGAESEYDRVTIATFDKFADVETSYPPEVFSKTHPNLTFAEILARTVAVRKQARQELIELTDSTQLNPQPLPPYAVIAFFKPEPGKGAEAVELVRKYQKPLHQERVNRGILKGWQYFNVTFPGGASREYNHIGLSFLDKFEHMETIFPEGLFSKVHPNTNSADVTAKLNAVRKLVRSEVLTLLEQVP
jgi:hypothetical protein